jgi:hypothetical protein
MAHARTEVIMVSSDTAVFLCTGEGAFVPVAHKKPILSSGEETPAVVLGCLDLG